jgi:ABC-2 type transport system permease protein
MNNMPANTPSNVAREPSFEAQTVAPVTLANTRPFYWSVRRELWENRSIYLAPLIAASVFLLGFLASLVGLPHRMQAALALDPMQQHEAIAAPYDMVAGLMMLTGILVSVFYCLDALYGERRDRSILFWKSLPVSDLTTVLAKASIPFIVLPLIVFVTSVVAHLIMLLCSSVVVLGSGQSVAALWKMVPLPQMSWLLFYHLLTAHVLWPAPVYCWLLLVSGWARRATFLWAVLPVLVIAGVERIIFHTSNFAMTVGSHLIGNAPAVDFSAGDVFPTNPMTHVAPGSFLSSPGLWMGLALAAIFLAAAVKLRRYREPI